jgi:hypothetical protein
MLRGSKEIVRQSFSLEQEWAIILAGGLCHHLRQASRTQRLYRRKVVKRSIYAFHLCTKEIEGVSINMGLKGTN